MSYLSSITHNPYNYCPKTLLSCDNKPVHRRLRAGTALKKTCTLFLRSCGLRYSTTRLRYCTTRRDQLTRAVNLDAARNWKEQNIPRRGKV